MEAIQLKINPCYLSYLFLNNVIQKEKEEKITFLCRSSYKEILTLRVTNSNSYLVISSYYKNKPQKDIKIDIYLSLQKYYKNLTLLTLHLEHSMNFQQIIKIFKNMILINQYFKTKINNKTMIKMLKKDLVNCFLIENSHSLHKNDKQNLIHKFHHYSQIMDIKQKNFQNIKYI